MMDSEPPICTKKQLLKKACTQSKSTVVRDFEQNGDILLYQYFSQPELFEIIARVAVEQSKNTALENKLLHQKIESVLGQIIRIPNANNKIKRTNLKVEIKYDIDIEEEIDQMKNVDLPETPMTPIQEKIEIENENEDKD